MNFLDNLVRIARASADFQAAKKFQNWRKRNFGKKSEKDAKIAFSHESKSPKTQIFEILLRIFFLDFKTSKLYFCEKNYRAKSWHQKVNMNNKKLYKFFENLLWPRKSHGNVRSRFLVFQAFLDTVASIGPQRQLIKIFNLQENSCGLEMVTLTEAGNF